MSDRSAGVKRVGAGHPGGQCPKSGPSLTPRARAATRRLVRERSGGEALAQDTLPHLGALAAIRLRLAEQLGQLYVLLALSVLDVGLEAQGVLQSRVDVPDEVVVLVGRPGDVARLVRRGRHGSPPWSRRGRRGASPEIFTGRRRGETMVGNHPCRGHHLHRSRHPCRPRITSRPTATAAPAADPGVGCPSVDLRPQISQPLVGSAPGVVGLLPARGGVRPGRRVRPEELHPRQPALQVA